MPWSPLIGSQEELRGRIQAEQPIKHQQVWVDLDNYPWQAPEHQQLEWLSQHPVFTDFLMNRPETPAPEAQRPTPSAPAMPAARSTGMGAMQGPQMQPGDAWREVREPLERLLTPKYGGSAPGMGPQQGPMESAPSPWMQAQKVMQPAPSMPSMPSPSMPSMPSPSMPSMPSPSMPAQMGPSQDPYAGWAPSIWKWLAKKPEEYQPRSGRGGGGLPQFVP